VWKATVYVTDLRDWTRPIFQGEAEHDDPRHLLPYLLGIVCRDPVIDRMTYLNLPTDGLSVVLYLARQDSLRNSSSARPSQELPSLLTTPAERATPSSGRSSLKTPTGTGPSEFFPPSR
jgi:hypothetical protein